MYAAFLVYLIHIIPSIGSMLVIFSCILALFIFAGRLYIVSLKDDYKIPQSNEEIQKVESYIRKSVIALFICLGVSSFIPSQKTMYYMAGAYLAQEISNSGTGEKLKKIVDAKLDEYIDESIKKNVK